MAECSTSAPGLVGLLRTFCGATTGARLELPEVLTAGVTLDFSSSFFVELGFEVVGIGVVVSAALAAIWSVLAPQPIVLSNLQSNLLVNSPSRPSSSALLPLPFHGTHETQKHTKRAEKLTTNNKR